MIGFAGLADLGRSYEAPTDKAPYYTLPIGKAPEPYPNPIVPLLVESTNEAPEELNIERAIEAMYDVMWSINPEPKPKIQIGPLDV